MTVILLLTKQSQNEFKKYTKNTIKYNKIDNNIKSVTMVFHYYFSVHSRKL